MLLTLPSLRLHRRNCHRIDNVLGFAAAGEVVAGAVEALEDGADGGAAG